MSCHEGQVRVAVHRIGVQALGPAMTPGGALELEGAFSTSELEYCRARKGGAESLAARLAAKLAILEVLGLPTDHLAHLGPQLTFRRLASGQPVLDPGALHLLPPKSQLMVSMTHSSSHAIAAVVLSLGHSAANNRSTRGECQ